MSEEETTFQPAPLSTMASTVGEFTRFEHATVGSLYLVAAVGGVITNLLLIITLLKDKTVFRGSSCWLHVSLAIANVFVVAPSPFPASSSFSGRWLYGDWMCQAYAFEGMFVGISAIGVVIGLCVERYVVSVRKEAMQHNSSVFYWVATGVNLGNAAFWATMPLLGWTRYTLDHTGTSCALDWKNPDEGYVSYMTMLIIFSFGVPLTAALLCLYKAIPSPAGPVRRAPVAAAQAGTSASGGQDEETSCFNESQLRWLCLTFLLLVLVGWGPFALLCGWAMVGDTAGVSMLAACIPPLACKAMTMAYPLAYLVASPRLRAGYLSFLGVGCCNDALDKSE